MLGGLAGACDWQNAGPDLTEGFADRGSVLCAHTLRRPASALTCGGKPFGAGPGLI